MEKPSKQDKLIKPAKHDKYDKYEQFDKYGHHNYYENYDDKYNKDYKYDKQVVIHEHKILYKADAQHVKHVLDIRNKINPICGNHMHRHVVVETVDGHKYTGVIVHVDERCLYLQCAWQDPRSFMPYNVILPLVLFELLVISLL
ncbi:hypothetical protein [Paenibacillus xylaniclasticus]|uniref:hypothetical protein n=1 Tax=Paenibacillus xylaniclasticus TaxID=588083 RepID=UPI000FD82369|nr:MULTISPECIES: hypothetical protein [Paenibacillus]GFN31555.1 hypothetical protein PCURB6_18150 [Paenibacillus curdlanolyticus]